MLLYYWLAVSSCYFWKMHYCSQFFNPALYSTLCRVRNVVVPLTWDGVYFLVLPVLGWATWFSLANRMLVDMMMAKASSTLTCFGLPSCNSALPWAHPGSPQFPEEWHVEQSYSNQLTHPQREAQLSQKTCRLKYMRINTSCYMPLGLGVNLLSNIFVAIVNGFITFPVSVISSGVFWSPYLNTCACFIELPAE